MRNWIRLDKNQAKQLLQRMTPLITKTDIRMNLSYEVSICVFLEAEKGLGLGLGYVNKGGSLPTETIRRVYLTPTENERGTRKKMEIALIDGTSASVAPP